MKILKYKKNRETYRVFLSTGEVVDLYDEVIIKYNLLYKKELTEECLNEIKNFNDYVMAYNMALKNLSVRIRAESEVRSYLSRKKYSSDVINYVIDRLVSNGLINDANFTKAFIHDKLCFTSLGEYRIKDELNKLKIDSETVNLFLEEISDDVWNERIDTLIKKYLAKKTKYTKDVLKNKAYVYLVNLGYSKYLVINKLNEYFS